MFVLASLALLSFAIHHHGSMSRIEFNRAIEINPDLDAGHSEVFADGSERR